ncbi:MAG: TolC family protein [Longimicrobiales bacterium]
MRRRTKCIGAGSVELETGSQPADRSPFGGVGRDWRVLLLVSTALAAAAPLAAQDPARQDTLRLTLREAQRLALERSPSFLADLEERDIARADLRQARVLPFNPRIELATPGAATDGGFGRYEAALSQEIEWAGQRGLRIDAAESGVRRAASTVRDAARRTVAETSEAYYTALAAARTLEVAEEILSANERLLAAVRTQLGEGEISTLEASLAEIEVARARGRVLGARREARSSELALTRTIGLAPYTPIQLVREVPEAPEATTLRPDSLLQVALERRPDLAVSEAAVAELEASARLVRREAVPNLEISALAEREESFGESRFGVGVAFPVPLWNRNQGTADRVDAEARQSAWSRNAVEVQVRTEVADAYQAYLAASEEAAIFERDVLRPARQNQQLLETAYREGKIDLTALLLLRNQLLDAELSYWDSWLAHRRSLIALQAATATIGTGLGEIDGDVEQRWRVNR